MKELLLKAVTNRSQYRDFINLPWRLFKRDAHWVPPLKMTIKDYLNVRKNPFYRHSRLKLWNLYDGKKCVGRIAGIIDQKNNEFHDEKVVFWGFFEAIENASGSQLLFDAVKKWGQEQGMQTLRGPVSPSTNHECGLQISGFDADPYFMMPMNPPYYVKQVETFGFQKAKDLYAWRGDPTVHTFDARVQRIAEKQIAKKRYKFRSLNMADFDNEIHCLFDIYNDAWEKNWGFVPMNESEFKHMAKELKAIINPKLCILVEIDGDPVGFSLTVPNLNQIIKTIRNGRLLPWGIFKLLWRTKVRPSIDTYRIITLGVRKRYQAAGLGAILYQKTEKVLRDLSCREVECSWVLEDNHAMNAAMGNLGAELYKTYRLYETAI